MNGNILTKQKYAVAIWHSAGKGKSESARQFALELLAAYPVHTSIIPTPAVVPAANDFRLVVGVNGKIVAVESQGDPYTGLQQRLEDLALKHSAELIVCTCRTRGETVDAVSNLRSHGFEIIWTSTYELDGAAQQVIANNAKGRHILNLLQVLGII
ncbi:MAG: hypothetical protein EOO51_00150 [Flavobacterium sp.]|nr:MAG: hypothetical protein EOO51_00150 [Flavobacterium sp.]